MDSIYKILNDESFIYLDRYNKSLQIFDIIPQNERTHSSIIAWLINPNEGHGMGDYFLKNMMYSLASDENFPLSLNDIESISCGNIVIDTEVSVPDSSILDILMYDPINNYLFVIENKFGAGLTNNQLDRYSRWADSQTKKNPSITKVLILIDGLNTISSVEKGWSVTNYEWLINSISSLLGRGILSVENEKFLRDYYISIEGDYSFDPQLEDNEKHLANLAERYPKFIDQLQNGLSSLLDNNVIDFINKKNISDYQFSSLIQKYKSVFLELINYCKYDWMEQQLQDSLSSFEFQNKTNIFNAFPISWRPFMVESDGYWPIHIRLEENDDNNGKPFILSMRLNKQNIRPEKEDMLESIAKDKGKKFRKDQKLLTIIIHEFNHWNKDQIFSIFKKELELVASSI